MEDEKTLVAVHQVDEQIRDSRENEILVRGATVGRYLLLNQLGAGGMGVVYAAYDPELDRRVALKMLLTRPHTTGSDGRSRLLREAQALAKLSHPNVVAVHDVGTHAEQVWIAMEFVPGQTLGAWGKERPRRWPELLRVLTDAARGVAAAHAAGLVHRDLKPDNVMVGRDDRVRVMDFGLAHGRLPVVHDQVTATTQPADTAARPELAALALRLTSAGAVQGTPAYMAPEQWHGQEAQAATDQFGWSVMAWELLYGERPFAGSTVLALAAAVLTGRSRPPPYGSKVPGWLRRLIERGLSTDPTQRWPTMTSMLAALERGQVRARLRTAGFVLAGAAAVIGAVEGSRQWDIARRVTACEAAGAEIDAIWNDQAREPLRQAFLATEVSYAATTADRVMPWLDTQAAAWRSARTETCLDADVRGLLSPDSLDRATWCLEYRRDELSSMVNEFSRASGTTVRKAVAAAAALSRIEPCRDPMLLGRLPAPPTRGRAEIQALRVELSRVQSLGAAGNPKDAAVAATAARVRAEQEIDWLPALALASASEGSLLHGAGSYDAAAAAQSAAYFAAVRSSAWDIAAAAATDLIYTVGVRQARHADGRAWARHAEAVAEQSADPMHLLAARRHNNLGLLEDAAGAYAEARVHHERSAELYEAVLGPTHPYFAMSLDNLASTLRQAGEYTKARTLFDRSRTILETTLGPLHPDVASNLTNQSIVLGKLGDHAAEQAMLERSLAVLEASLGPDHPHVAMTLGNLANVHRTLGRLAESRALHTRALEIFEKKLGSDHPNVAMTLGNLANVASSAGEYAEAQALYKRMLPLLERSLGPDHPLVAATLANLAGALSSTGAFAEARPLHDRALAIQEKALGGEHPDVALTLVHIAELDVAEQAPRAALPLLERAVRIYEAHDGAQEWEFEAHMKLAEVLIAVGGDHARALAAANKARDGFRGTGTPTKVEAAEQFLTRHGR